MMNKVAQFYRELVSTLSERLRNGERDIDALVEQARMKISQSGELTHREVETLTKAVRRDLEEFARSYEESQDELTDSVFMRVIKESLWQELADITDKTQLEWREVFQDLNHHYNPLHLHLHLTSDLPSTSHLISFLIYPPPHI